MRILVLNGNPDPFKTAFETYLQNLTEALKNQNHLVQKINIRDYDIKYCTGCWSCWWATPGKCAFKDYSHDICRAYINSDFVLLASPLILGFPSAPLKKVMDKLIPLVHPYIILDQNEFHHLPRYDHYPKLGVLLEKEADTDVTDLQIVSDIYRRFSVNLKSPFCFQNTTDEPMEVLTHAINHL